MNICISCLDAIATGYRCEPCQLEYDQELYWQENLYEDPVRYPWSLLPTPQANDFKGSTKDNQWGSQSTHNLEAVILRLIAEQETS